MTKIEIGRLLRAGTGGFVAGCRVSQLTSPSFGALVMANPEGDEQYKIYGLIHDIHIDDDGLVRQLVTSENISAAVMNDNRVNRIVPVEMSVLAVGYEQEGRIYHLLPPRPPLSLDAIYLCETDEVARFTARLGYLRHILHAKEIPIGEVIAAHLQKASQAHGPNSQSWKEKATQEIITLLRDDYPTLISVLSALSEVVD
jgi:hypothetical protein